MFAVKLFFCCALVAASLKDTRALSKEEAKELYATILPHIEECSKEYSLAEGVLKKAREDKSTDGIPPCFFSCVLKKQEMINSEGKFDTEKALEKAKEHFKDEEDVKKVENMINDCASVNSEDVEECVRAKSLFECIVKHKGDFIAAA